MNISNKMLRKMFISGSNAIINNSQKIDQLNVFPVPDGDTGSNMSSSVKEAIVEMEKISSHSGIPEITSSFARGMLLGARGNSGVILSQIFKGISIGLKDLKDDKKIEVNDLIKSFEKASEFAYKSVMKPVEGTILTVIREVSENLSKNLKSYENCLDAMKSATIEAKKSLDNTPNHLPILKEVGVVDSGGEGLYQFIKGMELALLNKPVKLENKSNNLRTTQNIDFIMKDEIYDGEFGYCIEFIIDLKSPKNFNENKCKNELMKDSSSVVIVVDDDILKIHLHSEKPGNILNSAQKYGEFRKIKIENMSIQANTTKNLASFNEKIDGNYKVALISIANGQGIINEMKKLGATFIIEGGQTMNPSASDIIEAIKSIDCVDVIILPNNSNIILTSQQAAKTIKDKNVYVIPTKTSMQGLIAIMNFNSNGTVKENKEEMLDAIASIKTCQVTKATRTTKVNGVKVKKGEFISIVDGEIKNSNYSKVNVAFNTLKETIDNETEIITIYYGLDATEVDANELKMKLENEYDIEVEVKNGMQPIYEFLISIE